LFSSANQARDDVFGEFSSEQKDDDDFGDFASATADDGGFAGFAAGSPAAAVGAANGIFGQLDWEGDAAQPAPEPGLPSLQSAPARLEPAAGADLFRGPAPALAVGAAAMDLFGDLLSGAPTAPAQAQASPLVGSGPAAVPVTLFGGGGAPSGMQLQMRPPQMMYPQPLQQMFQQPQMGGGMMAMADNRMHVQQQQFGGIQQMHPQQQSMPKMMPQQQMMAQMRTQMIPQIGVQPQGMMARSMSSPGQMPGNMGGAPMRAPGGGIPDNLFQ
jgi:hypothetical protein